MAVKLFHDLKLPRKNPSSLVSGRSLNAWLQALCRRRIEFIGADSAHETSGLHVEKPGSGVSTGASGLWTVEAGMSGYTVGYGTINGLVPTIHGTPIDEEFRTASTIRPELPFRKDGTIAILVNARFSHPLIPAMGTVSVDQPPFASTLTFLAFPEIGWQFNIESTRHIPFPPGGTSNDATFWIPLARVSNGVARRLRWSNVFLSRPYIDNVNEASDNLPT